MRLDRWPMSIAFVKDPNGYLVELTQRHPWKDGDDHHPHLAQPVLHLRHRPRAHPIAFYELLGLECTSRTDIPGHAEAILENPGQGGKLQLAQQLDNDAPIDMGTSMWKLYVHTDDCEALHRTRRRRRPHVARRTACQPERWPVTISFLADPDGYQVELVERHPASRTG